MPAVVSLPYFGRKVSRQPSAVEAEGYTLAAVVSLPNPSSQMSLVVEAGYMVAAKGKGKGTTDDERKVSLPH